MKTAEKILLEINQIKDDMGIEHATFTTIDEYFKE